MKRNIIQVISFVLLSNIIFAQDIHYSQYYANKLALNPAMAGANYDLSVNLSYKDQWRSLISPYKTYTLGVDKRIRLGRSKNFLALGLVFHNDQNSVLNSTIGNLNIAYHLRTGKYSKIGTGLLIGFGQKNTNNFAFQTGSQYNGQQYDQNLASGENMSLNSFGYLDAGIGTVWTFDDSNGKNNVISGSGKKMNIGASLTHLNRPKNSFYGVDERLPIKYTIHGDGGIGLNGMRLSVLPSFILNIQGKQKEIILGSMLRYQMMGASKVTNFKNSAAVSLGAHYRYKDAIILATMLEVSSYTFGLSYDVTASKLSKYSNGRGGIEFFIRFVTPNPFGGSKSRI